MQITRTSGLQPALGAQKTESGQNVQKQDAPVAPQESFSFSEAEKTPTFVKAGKYALAAATTAGAGALAIYASNNVGTAATVAGVASGALAGATGAGLVGLTADIFGGFMSNTNYTTPLAIGGAAAGAVGGGLIGAYVNNSLAGGAMALASGVSALALTSMATNIGKE